LPIASDFAIVFGFTGRISIEPRFTASTIGLQPAACAPNSRVLLTPLIKPIRSSSLRPL
jgi:hypothetical protein